ncbi:hypothetical protein M0R45_010147 [Rubus argutus]|uniref:Myb-like domain-containing protein n=1 Tax=Rubus argutus TaxID=59490 RepID=A0AAW1Y752_RUBAR
MERQNAKLTEKARKEEYARIRTLVDNAYKRDPRIVKRKEAEKAEKQKKKQAKLRKICDRMEGKQGVELAKVLRDARCGDNNDLEGKKEEKKPQQQNGSVESNGTVLLASYEKKEKPWSKEEIELLRKGMLKFPKGTSRRWEVVSEFIGTGRSVEEILKATKTVLLQNLILAKLLILFLKKGNLHHLLPHHLQLEWKWKGYQLLRKMKTVPTRVISQKISRESHQVEGQKSRVLMIRMLQMDYPREASQRWERVAAAVPGKSVNQCKKKFSLLKESFRSKKTTA